MPFTSKISQQHFTPPSSPPSSSPASASSHQTDSAIDILSKVITPEQRHLLPSPQTSTLGKMEVVRADKATINKISGLVTDQLSSSSSLNQTTFPPTSLVSVPTVFPSPYSRELFSVINDLYTFAQTPAQKRACLCYLLYYQHYNAEFTESESRLLGYPIPLCAVQTQPGYIRTEFHRLFELMHPWIKTHLLRFLTLPHGSKEPSENFIKICSSSAIQVLQAFFEHEIQIQPLLSAGTHGTQKKQVVLVQITTADLSKADLMTILQEQLQKAIPPRKLGGMREKHPGLYFLFLLQDPNIDCSLLWVATWAAPKKNNSLQCLKLNDIFEDKVFSLLNEAGAVSDRLSVNDFLTQGLGTGKFFYDLQSIGIKPIGKEETSITDANQPNIWCRQIKEITTYKFINDPGSACLRDAILQWHSCFFQNYKLLEFASPLLCSQVLPWISEKAGIVQWAKAYQNLCEIVMFCLQSFPEKFAGLDFDSTVMNMLGTQEQFSNIHVSIGLFPYAMTTVFDVFSRILNRSEFKGKPVQVACISQNYFETLDLVKNMFLQSHIKPQKPDLLDAIEGIPDILIADIHPNNAAKEKLFQNDIANWIKNCLTQHDSKKMILILDITLNHMSDHILKETFETLMPFIVNGRLEIFGIQSLAKLMQLGADNFSGGMCVYMGDLKAPEKHPIFLPKIPQKAAFFALINLHFQKITASYIELVRHNTEWMYQTLVKRFSNISKNIWIAKNEIEDDTGESKVQFCAAKITPNGDDNTVYIAISFKPLLNVLKIKEEKEKEALISRLRKLILELAAQRKLPITGRQSFGFSLSNMSDVSDSIRFSIGVENQALMMRYADLISDFSRALSSYLAEKPQSFNLSTFEKGICEIEAILNEGNSPSPLIVSLYEESIDEDGQGFIEVINKAEIHFVNHELILKIHENSDNGESVLTTVPQSEISLAKGYTFSIHCDWSSSDLLKLFFHAHCLNKSIYVITETREDKTSYAIGGFIESSFPFHESMQTKDEMSGISIVFEPQFCLILPDQTQYALDRVYVIIQKELGMTPVRLSKLDSQSLHKVFSQCTRYHLATEPYKGSILLQFPKRKPYLNYRETIANLYKQQGLSAVIEFLNSGILTKLPLSEEQDNKIKQKPKDSLYNILHRLGAHIVYQFTDDMIANMLKLVDEGCKRVILNGMFDDLLESCFDKKVLDQKVAKVIAAMLSRDDLPKFIDVYALDRWIQDTEKYLKKNSDDISWLNSYFSALFPLLKDMYATPVTLCDTDHSTSLKFIGEKAAASFNFLELKEHIDKLEASLPDHAAKKIKTEKSIANYLQLYLKYPLSPESKRDLLVALQTIAEDIRDKWIEYPNFYYAPMDRFEIGIAGDYDELILNENDQNMLQTFFKGIGCKAILLMDKEVHSVPTALRWAIMTQDDALFLKVMEICRNPSFDQNTLERLKGYQGYLKTSVSCQVELISILDHL